ncbi:hypothetical protein ACIBHY_04960 [Nonomuraea sp. NPDC050547]|uniref:hypothetical protein n=1 Tax=Nonomuraea sp. NPDC050547 TaxID=3364368 RepID=UPI0037987A17
MKDTRSGAAAGLSEEAPGVSPGPPGPATRRPRAAGTRRPSTSPAIAAIKHLFDAADAPSPS